MTDNDQLLKISSGDGRVFRSENHLGFSTGPVEGLYEAVLSAERDGAEAFKQLAMLVVQSDFSLPGFVVVRLGASPAAFVFGDVRLRTGNEDLVIGGATSATWTEQQLSTSEITFLQVGTETESQSGHDTSLVLGNVPSDGFTFGHQAAEPAEEPVEDEESPEAWTPPEPEKSDDFDDEDDPVHVDPNFNPFADPTSVNLEQIGSAAVSDGPAPVVDLAPPAPALDREAELSEVSGVPAPPAPSGAAPHIPPPPGSVPPPRTNQPGSFDPSMTLGPNQNLMPSLDVDDQTIPKGVSSGSSLQPALSHGPSLGILRFDDGQVHELTQSLLVGRYPSKNGLPEGYDSIVIRGEHVSRIHWELRVENGEPWVIDLESTSGTSVEHPMGSGSEEVAAGEMRLLEDEARITFGDRWVSFESRRG